MLMPVQHNSCTRLIVLLVLNVRGTDSLVSMPFIRKMVAGNTKFGYMYDRTFEIDLTRNGLKRGPKSDLYLGLFFK